MRRRVPAAACQACAAECPIGAIELRPDGIAVGQNCVGCMRCAAACATRALTGSGFEPWNPDAVSPRTRRLRLECERAPEAPANDDAVLHAPCLGALSISDYLRLRLLAGERPIELIDRGLCARCPAASGGSLPGATVRRHLFALLEAWGLTHLAPGVRREAPPRGARVRQPHRRWFLGRIARLGSRRAPVAIVETARLRMELLEVFGARWGRPVPPSVLSGLAISEACDDHRICAAACPTRALTVFEEGALSGVAFDARLCIACNACVALCPTRAVSQARAPSGRMNRLTARPTRTCERCGTPFTDRGGAATCLECRKEAALLADAARLRRDQS